MPISSKSAAAILAGLALLLALQRIATYREPPEWDIAMYSVIGHEMNLGARLYQDIWDMKPPAIFATYALAEHVAGNGSFQLYFLSVSVAVVTMLGVSSAASTRGRGPGLWAAAFWSAAAFNVTSGASLPNTEVFINTALIWALAIVMRMKYTKGWSMAFVAGALLGVASMYKQVAIAPVAMLALGHVLCAPRAERNRAIEQSLIMAIVGVMVWCATFAYFSATGRRWIFVTTNFTYALFYGGNVGLNLLHSFQWSRLFPSQLLTLLPLIGAALLKIVLGPWQRPQRETSLLIFMAIGIQLAVAMPGQFFEHYYQLWIPTLAVAGGWAICRMSELIYPRRWPKWALGIGIFVALIQPQVQWYGLDSAQWAQRHYSHLFYECYLNAELIPDLVKPEEKLFIWSDETWMYWQAHRRPAAAAMFKNHTLIGPVATWLSEKTAEQLRSDPPELFIDWPDSNVPKDHPIVKVLKELYRPAPELGAKPPLLFYVRKGGRLDAK